MSVTSQTIACDWPGCDATVTLLEGEHLSDRGWEYRPFGEPGFWHACRQHTHHGSEAFREAIEGPDEPSPDPTEASP